MRRLRCSSFNEAAETLRETPLSKDQQISPHDDEYGLLEATVSNTRELRGWLLSYGSLVEVLEPKSLRRELMREVRETARMYRLASR